MEMIKQVLAKDRFAVDTVGIALVEDIKRPTSH